MPQFGVYDGKRKAEYHASQSTSPPCSRIKLEEETTTELQAIIGHEIGDGLPHVPPVAINHDNTTSTFVVDPLNRDTGWQMLCLARDFRRRKICGYLGFEDIMQMRKWEELDPKRWARIQDLTSASLDKVVLTDVLRVICNSGGVVAEILAYIEGLDLWEAPIVKEYLHPNIDKVARQCGIGDRSGVATIQFSMGIVGLVRESRAQFPDSGRFSNSPYFRYAEIKEKVYLAEFRN
jgi:hypothetical protein